MMRVNFAMHMYFGRIEKLKKVNLSSILFTKFFYKNLNYHKKFLKLIFRPGQINFTRKPLSVQSSKKSLKFQSISIAVYNKYRKIHINNCMQFLLQPINCTKLSLYYRILNNKTFVKLITQRNIIALIQIIQKQFATIQSTKIKQVPSPTKIKTTNPLNKPQKSSQQIQHLNKSMYSFIRLLTINLFQKDQYF
eukprot:TRINITY_DN4470_c1_g1_i1.p1 TRINITY_DN4470_c1_g1~~TRINITY_DN4470_c1_g1_i1.p1  ORF type:complete len:193 (+),score=-18.28 TRINITY_DN4470_c1_g1_i1:309-887(+)